MELTRAELYLLMNSNGPLWLVGVDLSGADLRGANLSHANQREACLPGADLSGAELTGAKLNGATVTEEQLLKAKSLEGATLPDGTKYTSKARPEPASRRQNPKRLKGSLSSPATSTRASSVMLDGLTLLAGLVLVLIALLEKHSFEHL